MKVTAAQLRTALATRTRSRVLKSLDDQRYVLGVAYPAARLDGHAEFMNPAELEHTAWDYLRRGREIGLVHADGTTQHGDVVESYIYRGPDWELVDASGRTQVVKAGDWLLGVIFDERVWPAIKARQLDGWSIDGVAKRRRIPRTDLDPTIDTSRRA